MIRSQPVYSHKRVVETVALVSLVSRYLGMRPDVVYLVYLGMRPDVVYRQS